MSEEKKLLEELFDLKLEWLAEKLDGKLTKILDQTTRTNGRVTKLEESTVGILEQTAVIRFLHRNPKTCVFIFAMIFVVPWSTIRENITNLLFKSI